MADFTPHAGVEDFELTAVVKPIGAKIDGNMIGQCYDEMGNEIPPPAGYSIVERSQLVSRLVCPSVEDAEGVPDVIFGQKADKLIGPGDAYIKGNTYTVRTIAPEAAVVESGPAVVAKL